MAFTFDGSGHTITDLDIQPGSYRKELDKEDVGGGNVPKLRLAADFKHIIDVFPEPVGSTTGLTLANLITLAMSKDSWAIATTDTEAGSPEGIIESVNYGGEGAAKATITIAPTA